MITTKRILRALLAITLSVGMLVSSPQSITRAAESADKITVSLIGKYDSADTAAIREIDTTRKLIRFRNHQTGKTYTLSYDNTSMMYDARGTVLSAALLEVGEIVDVTFLKSSKHITTLNVSSDAWVVENTRNHDLVRGDGTARIQGDIYRIDSRTLVMAEGDLALAEDVLDTDRITVSGIGKDIYSVVVTSGHGYVSLSSDTVEDHSLVGAWLELDNEVIHKISPNMMLSAPEGDYNLQILGNGASYQTEVNISRNQETVVDTGRVSISKPKESLITFEIIPEDAEVFVDGQRALTGVPQSINYGYHTLKVLAEGYVTQNKYLKVGTAKAVIQIELEKDSDAAADASSEDASTSVGSSSSASTLTSYPVGTIDFGESSSAASKAATVSSNSSSEEDKPNKEIKGYKIYFDKPYGAEVYFDGAYVGVVPTSINKISGNHEVILKMDGYETKSYRINVDKEEDNKSYSFPDLIEIKKDDDSSSSSSASSGDSSSSSDSSSTDGSSESGDSASTKDSSSSGDASTTEDSAPAGDSGASSDSASTENSSGEGDSASEESSKESSSSEDASKEGSTNEGASDAASAASGEG